MSTCIFTGMNSLLNNLPWVNPKSDFERLLKGTHTPKQMEFGKLWADETHALIDKANELPASHGRESDSATHWFSAGL